MQQKSQDINNYPGSFAVKKDVYMPDRQQIQAIKQRIQATIERQHLGVYFRENISSKGDGTSKIYVRIHKYVSQARQRIIIDLGQIEDVAQMSEDELVEEVRQKFTEKLDLKLATLSGKRG